MNRITFIETRAGWVVALLLTGLAFYYYYFSDGYKKLYDYYKDSIYSVPYVALTPASFPDFRIKILIPYHISNLTQRWIFFTITNGGDNYYEDLVVWAELLKEDGEEHATPLLLPTYTTAEEFDNYLFIGNLAPHSSVTGRIPLYARYEDEDKKVEPHVWIGAIQSNVSEELQFEFPAINVKTPEAIKHTLVETLLLPPWSNGVIPAVVLLACWLVERSAALLVFDDGTNSKKVISYL